METLDQFIAKQQAELDKKKAEIAEFEALGPVPGLNPWLIYGKLYGYRNIGYKLADLKTFLDWAKANCQKVYAIEGRYKTFRPEIPKTKDYEGSSIVDDGDVEVIYSTIMRRFRVKVFVPGYCLEFEMPQSYVAALVPRAETCSYSDNYYGKRRIERWLKTGAGVRQYLRTGVDMQSADLETLLTWEQFEGYFLKSEVAA